MEDKPAREDRPPEHDSEHDRRLSELLAALPRERAAADFTAGVLQRIEAAPQWPALQWPAPRRPAPRRPALRWRRQAPLLAAAALLFICLAFGGRELWHRHQYQEAVARLEALHAEHDALEAELHRLRRLAVETRPVLYLGGDETVEYVVDLSRPHHRGEVVPARGRPAPSATPSLDTLSPAQLRQRPRRIY